MTSAETARAFAENLNVVTTGQRTPDEARAVNRDLRGTLTDAEWNVVKATAMRGMGA